MAGRLQAVGLGGRGSPGNARRLTAPVPTGFRLFRLERRGDGEEMKRVYVLNNSYECIGMTCVGRALAMVSEGKAHVVRWSEVALRTVKGVFKIPLIIQILRYIRAYGRVLKYHNRFVWERDNYQCQYCGKEHLTKSEIQTDHVIPDSRGGKAVYENMVTVCSVCNARKDNRTPEEAGMRLIRKPFRPQMSKGMARIADEARQLMMAQVMA